jgi:signal transduction histidine kinase
MSFQVSQKQLYLDL